MTEDVASSAQVHLDDFCDEYCPVICTHNEMTFHVLPVPIIAHLDGWTPQCLDIDSSPEILPEYGHNGSDGIRPTSCSVHHH